VFIAALLFRIGELTFWCYGGSLRDSLEDSLEHEEEDPEQAEYDVLGFRFRDLSLGLARQWKLGELLETSLRDDGAAHRRARIVHLSHDYVRAAEHHEDPVEVKLLLQEFSRFLSMSQQSVQKLLEGCLREAAAAVTACGAPSAAARITRMIPPDIELQPVPPPADITPGGPYLEFDPLLQLKILRELSGLISAKSDLNQFLETVLEGMYRSIGMDRAVFALANQEQTRLIAKFALGHGVEQLKERFDLPLNDMEPHIFYSAMEKKLMLWAKVGNPAGSPGFIQRRIRELVGVGPFFIAPVILHGKSVGLFYADRRISERPLDDESYQSFKHFAQQANLGLDFLGRQKGGRQA
jgi:hypothetical protein